MDSGITILPKLATLQPDYPPPILLTRPFTNPLSTRQVAVAYKASRFPQAKK